MRIAWLLVALSCFSAAQSPPPQDIFAVRTIFVDSLGQEEAAGIIRDKIINRLASSTRFQVVLDPDKADAVLTGSGEVSQSQRYNQGTGGTHYSATAVLRLVTKDQRILWTSEIKNGMFTRSVSSSVADRVVKELTKAATPPQPKKK